MRDFVAGVIAITVIFAPRPAAAWGFDVHRFITARAIALLPPEIRPFFEAEDLGDFISDEEREMGRREGDRGKLGVA